MMIRLLYLLFFASLSILLNAQKNDSIIGKVRSVREKMIFVKDTIHNYHDENEIGDYGHYGFSDPESEMSILENNWYHTMYTSFLNYKRKYNEKRELIEETWLDKKDSIYLKYIYKYDEMGNRIQIVQTWDDLEDSVIHNYFYDAKGSLRSDVRIIVDIPQYYLYKVYIYNEYDKLIQKKIFSEYGERESLKYEYDKKGRIAKIIYHNPHEGKSYLQTAYHYDETGRLDREESYDLNYDRSACELKITKQYSYDQKNRIITECYEYESTSSQYCTSNKYNTEGLLEEKTDKYRKTKYRYKDDRIVILEYEEDAYDRRSKAFVQFQYEFDSKGNWIRQIKIVNNVIWYERIREIEYFK